MYAEYPLEKVGQRIDGADSPRPISFRRTYTQKAENIDRDTHKGLIDARRPARER